MALGSHLITVRRLKKYIDDVIGKKANLPDASKTIIGNIAQINTDLSWKHLGTYAFNTNASLPASYDEICLIAKQSNDTNSGIYPMVIPKIALQVSAGIFSNGTSNAGAGGSTHIMLEISQTTAKLTRYRYNSSTDITTSVLDIYYK